MRELVSHRVNGLNESLSIRVTDERGPGNANHRYIIDGPMQEVGYPKFRCDINFQKGPIAEAGENGISNESLLAVVEDRLLGFQAGEYSSRENALALTAIQEAMMWLQKRTRDRMARGVEGTNMI